MQRIILFLACLPLLCGCRAMQSELQRSKIQSTAPTAMIQGQQLRLETQLWQANASPHSFDLRGNLKVACPEGSLPPGVQMTHFTLRPTRAGSYVMNFTRRGRAWELVGAHGIDSNFMGLSNDTKDALAVEFTWRNRGGGWFQKPEHFAAFDVSATVTDAQGKRHTLSNLSVPTR